MDQIIVWGCNFCFSFTLINSTLTRKKILMITKINFIKSLFSFIYSLDFIDIIKLRIKIIME